MRYVVLANRGDQAKVEIEERAIYLHTILSKIGIDFEDIWPDPAEELSIEKKIEMRKLLKKYDIEIIDSGKETKIYANNDLIAHWKTPKYTLKKDLNKVNKNEQLYFEIIFEAEGLFDDEMPSEEEQKE